MIITTAQLDEKSMAFAEHAGTQGTQVYYAAMPEPSVPASADAIARLSLADNEAPPAYEAASINIESNTSQQRAVNRKIGSQSENMPTGRERGLPRASSSSYPLSTPPVSFTRGIPSGLPRSMTAGSSGRFPPLVLHSKGKNLEEGFYLIAPPTDIQPHPFAQRDVNEADWTRFLTDLQTSASTTGADPRPSPGRSNSSLFTTFFRSMSSTNLGKQRDDAAHVGPSALLDAWNKQFFNPRGFDVVLAKGTRRLNGDKNLPPPDSAASDSTPSEPSGLSAMGFGAGLGAGFGMGKGRGRGCSGGASRGWAAERRGRCGMPRAGLAAEYEHLPIPGAMPQANPMSRRARSLSVSSDSSESSVSSCDNDNRRQQARSGPGLDYPSTQADRKAEKRARRAARREARRERRFSRKEARCMRKLGRLEAHLTKKAMGRHPSTGGAAVRADIVRELVCYGLGMLPVRVGAGSDDGYYRLVVADIGFAH